MANKTKSDYDKMTNDELVTYLDKLPIETFRGYVDGDTKVRYFSGCNTLSEGKERFRNL